MPTALSSAFYDRDPVAVARELLGKLLIRRSREGTCAGRIVETEAYLSMSDPACHATRGMTRKNKTMFGPPGLAYVYPIHARYCLNAVTEPRGQASAVLIRAVEPLQGMSLMSRRRSTDRLLDLARGPSRLCEAFDIPRRFDGWKLTTPRSLWIEEDTNSTSVDFTIATSPRIGVTSAQEALLRFFVNGSRFVSGPRKWHST